MLFFDGYSLWIIIHKGDHIRAAKVKVGVACSLVDPCNTGRLLSLNSKLSWFDSNETRERW